MLVIGSISLSNVYNIRRPLDLDIIGSKDEMVDFVRNREYSLRKQKHNHYIYFNKNATPNILEWTVPLIDSTDEELLNLTDSWKGWNLASLDVLYTLKMSHRFKKDSKHFIKTMKDIKLMKQLGAEIFNDEWFKLREKETYVKKRPNLKVSKSKFFNKNTVPYKYDHDTLHLAVMLQDNPAYTYFKPDQNDVFCSEEMFNELDYSIQINSVIEESMVLALERSLIHNKFRTGQRKMFIFALQKLATSISSGWWRDFVYDNYHNAIKIYNTLDQNYMRNRFNNGIESNIIELYNDE